MTKRFDRLLDKATELTLIEPNWDAIIECVDFIRGGEVPIKYALTSIRKRFHYENPHVAHHALLVLEACVKNCGSKFHTEIATKEFMEDLRHMAMEQGTADKVKAKILELLQCWATAFRDKAEYKIVVDTHGLMKLEGFSFPQLREAEAMFAAQCAPDWAEGEECYRCRTRFGLLNRKHHCRCCGQIFCDRCSNRQMHLPVFGIEKAVRVCESCYDKSGKKNEANSKPTVNDENVNKSLEGGKKTTENIGDPDRDAAELKRREEEQLALALAISQSEAEEQERQRQLKLYHIYNGSESVTDVQSVISENSPSVYKGAASSERGQTSREAREATNVDPELARYLNRDYWQQRKADQKNEMTKRQSPTPSAPPPSETSVNGYGMNEIAKQTGAENGFDPMKSSSTDDSKEALEDTAKFCNHLKQQVEVMENRIRSNQARGRSIVNDSGIQTLFVKLTEMHAAVLARMQILDDQRNHFESLQDQLAHIQEARQAVNALRDDHNKRRHEQMLEEQRLRQAQMQQKLDLMRHKKHEMLMYQRHQALQRFQQQEQELQMRRLQQHAQPVIAQPGVGYGGEYHQPGQVHPQPGQVYPHYHQPGQVHLQQQQKHSQYGQSPGAMANLVHSGPAFGHMMTESNAYVQGGYANDSTMSGGPQQHQLPQQQHQQLPQQHQQLPQQHQPMMIPQGAQFIHGNQYNATVPQHQQQYLPNHVNYPQQTHYPQPPAPIAQQHHQQYGVPVSMQELPQHQQPYLPSNMPPPSYPGPPNFVPNSPYQQPAVNNAPPQPAEGLLISFD